MFEIEHMHVVKPSNWTFYVRNIVDATMSHHAIRLTEQPTTKQNNNRG